MQLLNIHLQYQKIPWFKIHFVRQAVCKYSWGISLLFHLNYCWDCFWGVWYWLRYTWVLGQTFSVCPLPLPSENDGERWQIRCQMMSCNGKQALLWIVIGCVVCLCQSIHLWVRQGSAFHSRWVPPQPHMGQAALLWEKPCCLQLLLICQPQKSSAEMLQGKKNHKCCQLELWRKKSVLSSRSVCPIYLHWACFQSLMGEGSSRSWGLLPSRTGEGGCSLLWVWAADRGRDPVHQKQGMILQTNGARLFLKTAKDQAVVPVATEFGTLSLRAQLLPLLFLLLRGLPPWFVTYTVSRLYSGFSKTGCIIVLRILREFFSLCLHGLLTMKVSRKLLKLHLPLKEC